MTTTTSPHPDPDKHAHELAMSLLAYIEAHPEQRFWQALHNWSGMVRIEAQRSESDDRVFDTYYFKGVTR